MAECVASLCLGISPSLLLFTEPEKMACTWFGEVYSCCCLTSLPKPAWVLLDYVLQTIFSGAVYYSCYDPL